MNFLAETKNQWARDDPAFLVVEALFVAVSISITHSCTLLTNAYNFVMKVTSLAYAIAFKNYSFWGYLWVIFYSVFVDWFLVGCAIASISR